MSQQQDVSLTERLKENDLAAFDELYLKYFKLLCANAYFFLKSESDAKDLVQNLFMDIWDKKLYLNFHNDIKGYLFLAVKNRSLNLIKKQKVQEAKKQGFNMSGITNDNEITDEEEQGRFHEKLYDVLSNMKGQKKAAITMVYFNDKKYSEAAEGMGIGVNSLKTHLKTALKKLREGMKAKK